MLELSYRSIIKHSSLTASSLIVSASLATWQNNPFSGPSKISRTPTNYFSCWFERNSIILGMTMAPNIARLPGFPGEIGNGSRTA